jgi:hypothetical protein
LDDNPLIVVEKKSDKHRNCLLEARNNAFRFCHKFSLKSWTYEVPLKSSQAHTYSVLIDWGQIPSHVRYFARKHSPLLRQGRREFCLSFRTYANKRKNSNSPQIRLVYLGLGKAKIIDLSHIQRGSTSQHGQFHVHGYFTEHSS